MNKNRRERGTDQSESVANQVTLYAMYWGRKKKERKGKDGENEAKKEVIGNMIDNIDMRKGREKECSVTKSKAKDRNKTKSMTSLAEVNQLKNVADWGDAIRK